MIQGELVNLRAVERADAPLLYRWLNDPVVMRGWGAPEHTVSAAEVQRRLEGYLQDETERGRPVCLVIETLEGEAIGQIVLSQEQPEARSAELSLMIGEPSLWGRGYGGDALQTAVAACFDAWNLHRVWLRSEAANTRAHRLYARCGFAHEGTLREAAFLDGRYQDVLVFGLLSHQHSARNDQLGSVDPEPAARDDRAGGLNLADSGHESRSSMAESQKPMTDG